MVIAVLYDFVATNCLTGSEYIPDKWISGFNSWFTSNHLSSSEYLIFISVHPLILSLCSLGDQFARWISTFYCNSGLYML